MPRTHSFPGNLVHTAPARVALDHHLLGEPGRDLRRSLWTILVSAQLLLRSPELSPRDARLADRIDAAAHRLARLARDLVDEALAASGLEMPLTPVATDMCDLAQQAIVEAKIDNPDRWIMQASAGDGAAEWDHDRVPQLLSNLLSHALDHGRDGSPVSFAWWGDADEIVVEIEYDPDTDTAGREPEWTLGLSVAREIARAHGGELAVRDMPSGRLFRVALPRRIDVAPELSGPFGDATAVETDGAA